MGAVSQPVEGFADVADHLVLQTDNVQTVTFVTTQHGRIRNGQVSIFQYFGHSTRVQKAHQAGVRLGIVFETFFV